jgi:hypothetical protein
MTKQIDRDKLREVLNSVIGGENPDQLLIIDLMGACAYVMAYPEKVTREQYDMLRDAYIQVRELGHT